MKRIAICVVVFGAALAALRRFGPALGAQVMQKCQGMFARMPEEFSPKRMMRDIEEIKEQTAHPALP